MLSDTYQSVLSGRSSVLSGTGNLKFGHHQRNVSLNSTCSIKMVKVTKMDEEELQTVREKEILQDFN